MGLEARMRMPIRPLDVKGVDGARARDTDTGKSNAGFRGEQDAALDNSDTATAGAW